MSYLIDKRVLYKQTAEWEAQALAMVEKTMHNEDPTEWRRWSAVLTERTAFKHDVADAPTVEVPTWIPCSERLPRIGQYCFITSKDGDVNMDKYCSYGWRNYGDNVLAWMELPEPYEESGA